MKRRIFKLLLMIWVFIMLFSMGAVADESVVEDVIFQMEDPLGDELGPGTYTYPTHKHFEPYKGLFDLTSFQVFDGGSDYKLEFTFAELSDPWRAKYGFSHPLIQLYIDNAPGGETELFRKGVNVKLDSAAPWDVMLHVSGWWVRLFRPTDRSKLDTMDIYWNDAKNPFDLETARVKRDGNTVRVLIPKATLGELKTAKIFLLIGSFYAFGYDHYRDISKTSSDWSFGGAANPELAPRVLDMLLPEGLEQSNVLWVPKEAHDMVTIPYISMSGESQAVLSEQTLIWIAIIVVALALAVIVITKSKKNPISG